jgi:Flp pilus assembly pilin Flp
MKWRLIMSRFDEFLNEETGMGVVEVILIMVVLIAMCIIFKKQITNLVNNIWNSINTSAKKIY